MRAAWRSVQEVLGIVTVVLIISAVVCAPVAIWWSRTIGSWMLVVLMLVLGVSGMFWLDRYRANAARRPIIQSTRCPRCRGHILICAEDTGQDVLRFLGTCRTCDTPHFFDIGREQVSVAVRLLAAATRIQREDLW